MIICQSALIESSRITDWESFHSLFAEVMGFPGFYGRNMNAWIDCMTCLDEPAPGMTRFCVQEGEFFQLEIVESKQFKKRLPEIFDALIECSAFVNWRKVEVGEPSVLTLLLR